MYKQCLLYLFFFLFSFSIAAQVRISGTVTDAATGETLIGANILVLGTNTGTITDYEGKYSLEVGTDAAKLQFSYTGYAVQVVDIGEQRTIDVAMSSGALLDEVVVVGYGSQSKVKLTSAISTIDEKTLRTLWWW